MFRTSNIRQIATFDISQKAMVWALYASTNLALTVGQVTAG